MRRRSVLWCFLLILYFSSATILKKSIAFLDKDAVDFLDNISATALEKIGSHTQLNATVSVKWKYNNETDGNIAKADYVIVDNKQKHKLKAAPVDFSKLTDNKFLNQVLLNLLLAKSEAVPVYSQQVFEKDGTTKSSMFYTPNAQANFQHGKAHLNLTFPFGFNNATDELKSRIYKTPHDVELSTANLLFDKDGILVSTGYLDHSALEFKVKVVENKSPSARILLDATDLVVEACGVSHDFLERIQHICAKMDLLHPKYNWQGYVNGEYGHFYRDVFVTMEYDGNEYTLLGSRKH